MTYLSRDKRREQIMNTVVDLVGNEGLGAATVRRIAQDLGCSPGQIHHHFSSADALRAEAVREVWRRLEPDFLCLLHRLPPRERLITILSDCCVELADDLNPLVATAQRLWKEALDTRREPAVRQAITEAITDMRAEIAVALQEGVDAGAFPAETDVARLSLALIAVSQGYDMLVEIYDVQDLGPTKSDFIDEALRKNGI